MAELNYSLNVNVKGLMGGIKAGAFGTEGTKPSGKAASAGFAFGGAALLGGGLTAISEGVNRIYDQLKTFLPLTGKGIGALIKSVTLLMRPLDMILNSGIMQIIHLVRPIARWVNKTLGVREWRHKPKGTTGIPTPEEMQGTMSGLGLPETMKMLDKYISASMSHPLAPYAQGPMPTAAQLGFGPDQGLAEAFGIAGKAANTASNAVKGTSSSLDTLATSANTSSTAAKGAGTAMKTTLDDLVTAVDLFSPKLKKTFNDALQKALPDTFNVRKTLYPWESFDWSKGGYSYGGP